MDTSYLTKNSVYQKNLYILDNYRLNKPTKIESRTLSKGCARKLDFFGVDKDYISTS